jgi:hypothetical protein
MLCQYIAKGNIDKIASLFALYSLYGFISVVLVGELAVVATVALAGWTALFPATVALAIFLLAG